MDRKNLWHLLYWIGALLAVLGIQTWLATSQVQLVGFDQFEQALRDDRLQQVVVTDTHLSGQLKTPEQGTRELVTVRIEPELARWLDGFHVPYRRVLQTSFWRDVLSWILPSLVFFGLWWLLIRKLVQRQGMGGLMQIGQSRAKVHVTQDTGVSFADVAGVDEAKQELQEVVDFLKHPEDYGRLGAHIPKGVLLVGPPGTGKTLLAKAVAGEAGVPFFSMSGSEFVELFVGVGASRVRDLFEQARKLAPAIVFIDELDALGRARGVLGGWGGHDEKEQTLNQLLAEMDGFDTTAGVIILAATNRPEILDPALLRAGRFDRQVLVDKPDRAGRVQILQVHVRRVTLAKDLSLGEVAALTPGFSGADLANLVNEAAIVATRRQAGEVTLADFTAAIERIVAGLEKRNRLLNPLERRTVAHHEIGHALVALSLPGSDVIHKVSIIPRGIGALGYTIQRPLEDRYLMTREELENRICILLGGRAAEQLALGTVSTGAADDLARATALARDMVMRHGMDEALGCVSYDSPHPAMLMDGLPEDWRSRPLVSEATQQAMDRAVHAIVSAALQRATQLLSQRREAMARCVKALLDKETLDAAALQTLLTQAESAPVAE